MFGGGHGDAAAKGRPGGGGGGGGGAAFGEGAGAGARCSRIHDGDRVNALVTAPGATLALGLMFLRTENAAVASRLSLPDTHFLLDFVRPDVLMLRVIARALVMWEGVAPTEEWVLGNCPDVVLASFELLAPKPRKRRPLHEYDEAEEAREAEAAAEEEAAARSFDRQTIRQAHANIVAGACFAVGLKFAGSAHQGAAALLHRWVRHFARLRGASAAADPAAAAQAPDRPTLEMCLAVAAQALALVMAGTGELSTLRLLRELRWRVDKGVTYGQHMALNMALGLLFLGGGDKTIGTDNQSVAALVVALFPRYPSNTTDNRYHLQAFRHLYVLAVKPRCVAAVDVDSGAPSYVPLTVTLKPTPLCRATTLRLWAPCLLPDFGTIASIAVDSPRYFPLQLDLGSGARGGQHAAQQLLAFRRIYVKVRRGATRWRAAPCSGHATS
jgi:anaphase-promoting complex subunit 1